MGWVAAVLAFVAVVYFSITYSMFRRAVLFLLALLVVASVLGGIAAYIYQKYEEDRRARAASLIQKSDLGFSQFTMETPTNSSALLDVVGVVKNNSAYTVDSLTITITIRDCDEGESSCEVVGSNDVWDSITIPPGQVREFRGLASFDGLPSLKNWRWSYTVKDVYAELPE